jgi:pimeloyl-ACP methyl ester carboxylesterase
MRLLLALLIAVPAGAEQVEARGVHFYYEVHGAGRPVVLLHGGLNSLRTSFANQIPAFSKSRRVIAIDQMAHGRTADVPGRPLTYEAMAEDTAALLTKIGIANADFVGWSDGGQIALRLAFAHPELVRRVVASGVGLGASPAAARQLNADTDFAKTAAALFPAGYADYQRYSPDGPGHWAVVAVKGRSMWSAATWGFSIQDLARIRRPVLIVAGDADIVPLEETVRIVRAIPKARLLILPGTGHSTFQDRPDWLNPVIRHFLDQP